MQTIKQSFYKFFLVLLIAAGRVEIAKAQDKEAEIMNLIQEQDFLFRAQTVLPLGGRMIPLTSEYDVNITDDTLQTHLPYFGRAFAAPINPTGGGFQFTSTDFDYNVREKKKGGWEITIQPKDVTDVRQMFLSVFRDGNASLRINSNNRQSISYNGYITQKKKTKRG